MNIGITCYPTVGGSGAVAAELGKQLARRGHKVHFVTQRMPFRLDNGDGANLWFHEVEIGVLSAVRAPAVRPRAGGQDGGGRARAQARPAARALRDPVRDHRLPGPADARRRRAAPGDHAARHRHHAGGPGPQLLRDHALRHRPLRRGDRRLRVPEADDGGRVRAPEADRGDLQLRGPRRVRPRARPASAPPTPPRTSASCSTSRTSAPSSASWTWCASSSAWRARCRRCC